MVAQALDLNASKGTLSEALVELDLPSGCAGLVRRIGRVRLPLALTYRPWATLYVLPDGRRWWIVHLWEVDRPVPRVVPTSTLLAFARQNGLTEVADAIDRLVRAADGAEGADGR